MTRDPMYGRTMGSFVNGGARFTGDHHRIYGWGQVADWESRAACRDTDIRIWFGSDVSVERGERRPYRTKEQTTEAKRICAGCPVLSECRAWALESRIPFGILGGMSERERQCSSTAMLGQPPESRATDARARRMGR
jgi:WhiB family transcriptional regulator, redox-sensing transcriptional regulator